MVFVLSTQDLLNLLDLTKIYNHYKEDNIPKDWTVGLVNPEGLSKLDKSTNICKSKSECGV